MPARPASPCAGACDPGPVHLRQGPRPKPTAAQIFAGRPGISTDFGGISRDADDADAPGSVELGPEATTIGREGTNDLVLDSTVVSGLHAEVRRDGDEYVIVDCDSTNGVVVNGSRLPARTESPLQHGDAISISDHLLLFLCRDSSADRMDFSTIQIDKSRATRESEALLKEFPALRMRLES